MMSLIGVKDAEKNKVTCLAIIMISKEIAAKTFFASSKAMLSIAAVSTSCSPFSWEISWILVGVFSDKGTLFN